MNISRALTVFWIYRTCKFEVKLLWQMSEYLLACVLQVPINVCLSTRKICSWAGVKVLVTFSVTIIYTNGFHYYFIGDLNGIVYCVTIYINHIITILHTTRVWHAMGLCDTSCLCLLRWCAAGKQRWGGQDVILLLSLSLFNDTSKPGESRVSFGSII